MKAMRPQPEYFAVGYYGQGFPSFLRVRILPHPTSGVLEALKVTTFAELPRKFGAKVLFLSQELFRAFQCLKRDESEMKFCVLPAWVESGCYNRFFR